MIEEAGAARRDTRPISLGGGARWCATALAAALLACGGGGGSGTQSHTIGGTVSGLIGSGLVLQNNGGNDLVLTANGAFTFSTSIKSGAAYDVTIKSQPLNPPQICTSTGASGTVGSVTVRDVAVSCGSISLLAGTPGGSGSVDGSGAAARFYSPVGVAADTAGNVYVADYDNQTIRKITSTGEVSTFAGTASHDGSADGNGAAAQFRFPFGVATDAAGNVYVADTGNNTIRKITPTGVVSTLAGMAGLRDFADGLGGAARFDAPTGVATDSAGNVYVADTGNDTIRKITPAGNVTTLAGSARQAGFADGSSSAARFYIPAGVATDSAGNVYVADRGNDTIRKITPAGVVSTLAGMAIQPGSADGTGSTARFSGPSGVATDSTGDVYVTDTSNNTIRKITPTGEVTTLAGMAGQSGSLNGDSNAARFTGPEGIATDSTGNIYVADAGNDVIRKVTSAGNVSTMAGAAAAQVGSADGSANAAQFHYPQGIATDAAGNVYVADTDNSTIRRINPAGDVSTLAGSAGQPGSVDGSGATARFDNPKGVATDSAGNVYVTDTGNSTIRKITPTGDVSTLAGTAGQAGFADGSGPAARFAIPSGIGTDATDNVYVTDFNGTIRKINTAGEVTTVAGTPGPAGSADGLGRAAQFFLPAGIAADSAGNVYVADSGNDTIRKITSAGEVSTVAGKAAQFGSADGSGATARFNDPSGIAIDSAGNVYVADTNNSTIRLISPAGTVTTVVGTAATRGDQVGPLPGSLNLPKSLALLPGPTVGLVETDAENVVLKILP